MREHAPVFHTHTQRRRQLFLDGGGAHPLARQSPSSFLSHLHGDACTTGTSQYRHLISRTMTAMTPSGTSLAVKTSSTEQARTDSPASSGWDRFARLVCLPCQPAHPITHVITPVSGIQNVAVRLSFQTEQLDRAATRTSHERP